MTHFVEELYGRMSDPSTADLNTTRLDGRQASDEDLRNAAFAMPFLADEMYQNLVRSFAPNVGGWPAWPKVRGASKARWPRRSTR